MNVPADIQELIDRHFHGLNSPEETARLEQMILSDPHAGAAMAEAARFEAMLQQRLPLRRKLPRWRPLLVMGGIGAAAAAVVAMLFWPGRRPDYPARNTDAAGEAGQEWVPIERAVLPVSVPTPGALAIWNKIHQHMPEEFVPAPRVVVDNWGMGEKEEREILVKYEKDWIERRALAQPRYVSENGTVDLGHGFMVKIEGISIWSPLWEDEETSFLDHRGLVLADDSAMRRFGRGTGTEKNASIVVTKLRFTSRSRLRLGKLSVLDANSHIDLGTMSAAEPREGLWNRDICELETWASLFSDTPITLMFDVGVPLSKAIQLPLRLNSSDRSEIAESIYLGGCEGIRSVRLKFGKVEGEDVYALTVPSDGDSMQPAQPKPGNKHDVQTGCTIALSLSAGMYADVMAVTSEGDVRPVSSEDELYWPVRFFCFPIPLSSVQSLKIQPLSRRRVMLTVKPPRDPMNGLNRGVTDLLEIRLPVASISDPRTERDVTGLLGVRQKMGEDIPSGDKAEPLLRNATLRQILMDYGRARHEKIEINLHTRYLRGVPHKDGNK